MKKMIATLAVSTALAAVPAAAQMFDDWDVDDDGFLSSAEFDPGVESAGWFGDWDLDDDEVLSANEFDTGMFLLFDDDGDEVLSVAEWDEGIDAWFGEATVDLEFSSWDEDGDGVLARPEFDEAMLVNGLYPEFAGADEVLTDVEFDEGLFDLFDADEDALLAQDEWEPIYTVID
ncbi:MAG TPA: hypothetical protein VFJ13_03980 [Paracoccaceae bacterium]|nr:hypothetical protein [Paracoccaceae bacterium]